MAVGKGDIRARLVMEPSPTVVTRAFRDAGVELENWKSAWPAAIVAMRAGVMRAIGSKGSTLGYPWPRPKAVYARRKIREGYGSERMVRTGWTGVATRAVINSPRGVRATKRSVSLGVFGDLAKRLTPLQFKRGYWQIGWDGASMLGAQSALRAFVDSVFAKVRTKFQSGGAA